MSFASAVRLLTLGAVLSAAACDSVPTDASPVSAERERPNYTANASEWTVGAEPGNHLYMHGDGIWFNANNGGFPSLRASLQREGNEFSVWSVGTLSLMGNTAVSTLVSTGLSSVEAMRIDTLYGHQQTGMMLYYTVGGTPTTRRVLVGDPNSSGYGYRSLRVLN